MAAAAVAPSPFPGHTFHLVLFYYAPRKTLSRRRIKNVDVGFRIKAIFWGPKKAVEPSKQDLSLGDFRLKELGIERDTSNIDKAQKLSVQVVSSISEISPNEWDACSLDAAGPEKFNPFLTHGFLSSLEESRCAVKETGWVPQHVVAQDDYNNVLGVVPLYLKSHSYGEYVFDHSWADAYYSYGSRYYPKLQCCVPFTPVTGPRILVRNTNYRDQVFDILVSTLVALAVKVSSLHITFSSENEWGKLEEKGFLQRVGMQYHWKNHNYKSFDDFLMDMKQSKRKNIRQERKKVSSVGFDFQQKGWFCRELAVKARGNIQTQSFSEEFSLCYFSLGSDYTGVIVSNKISAQNLTMKRLRGYEIKAKHWDTFYEFYRNTTDNKWGRAYLTREFFHNMASKLGDQVLLVAAEEGDELVAGALNLIGGDTLYGRLWGCLPQAIEAAIELNLDKVEAGAQGEHKIQRGYMPVPTYSCHLILDEGFRKVISDFLVRERAQLEHVMKLLHESGPFKDNVA